MKTLAVDVGISKACSALRFPRATFYRQINPVKKTPVYHPGRPHPRALSSGEKTAVLDQLHSERFMDKAPAEVYATLLDEGKYLCSIRTMYRILDDEGEVKERRNQRRHPSYKKPELLSEGPNEVWSWDITKLLGPVKWTYFYLFVILDIFSRYVVGWTLSRRESGAMAKQLIEETCLKQNIQPGQLVIHADRGPSMKSGTVSQLYAQLGVCKSFNRPYVSNDNPFSESQFKTMKYHPKFPERFGCFEDAMAFCRSFFKWYNQEHRHSGIGFMTPEMVHYGFADRILEQRRRTLLNAYSINPERFVGKIPEPPKIPDSVWINPPKIESNR